MVCSTLVPTLAQSSARFERLKGILMRTVLASTCGWYRISSKQGKFFLCRFNPDSGKYRPLHRHGTFYHIVLTMSPSVSWQFDDFTLPIQLSFYPLFEDPIAAGLWN